MRRIVAPLFLLVALLCMAMTAGYAEESQGFQFSAVMVPPKSQVGRAGYYHFTALPGETVTLQMQLTNLTDAPLEVKAVPLNAYSAQNGIVYRSPLDVDAEVSLLGDARYGLATGIAVTDAVVLPANQTETISFTVTVPDLDTGSVLGGIRFIAFAGLQQQAESVEQDTAQMMIDKYQAIVTAILIDLPQRASPAMAIGEPTFDAEQLAVTVPLLNQAAMIQPELTGSYEIRDAANQKLFGGDLGTLKMAPMTGFRVTLPWAYQTLAPGTYTLAVSLDADGTPFQFEKTFPVQQPALIKAQQTQARIDPTISVGLSPWFGVAMEIVVLVVIGLFIWHLRQKRRTKHS